VSRREFKDEHGSVVVVRVHFLELEVLPVLRVEGFGHRRRVGRETSGALCLVLKLLPGWFGSTRQLHGESDGKTPTLTLAGSGALK
jgi:hypothetical protein